MVDIMAVECVTMGLKTPPTRTGLASLRLLIYRTGNTSPDPWAAEDETR